MKYAKHLFQLKVRIAGFLLTAMLLLTVRTGHAQMTPAARHTDTATFAGGCFWCMEAQFSELKGVIKVVSGFSGGTKAHPSYTEVCSGTTGYAESCNIIFDPAVISYDALLAVFFTAHDPTQLNRQGNDIGTQYRSAVFYRNNRQQQLAAYYIRRLNASGAYDHKIVTELSAFKAFYPAEDYHQDYYANNQEKSYCRYVIKPKLDKFREVFKGKLKH